MSLAISPVSHAPAQETAAPSAKPEAKSKSVPVADTVHLSSAAQAALQEATETQSQTAHEAAGGDIQAGNLLARELAAAKNANG